MIRSLLVAAALGGSFAFAPALTARSTDLATTLGDGAESTGALTDEGAEETPPALSRALRAIDADEIEIDLRFLASDELGGRDTPSEELDVAAHFLRARLQRLGFQPGAGDSFFHEYPLNSTALDPDASSASFDETALVLTKDYYIGAPAVYEDSDVQGPIVSIGTGDVDEFEDLDLTGKWAMVKDREGRGTRSLNRRVTDRGAIGLLVAPGAEYEGEPLEERFGGDRFEALVRGRTSYAGSKSRGRRFNATPTTFLTREATERLLEACEGYDAAKDDWFPPVGADTGVRFRDVRALAADGGQVMVKNVCGFWPGSDPELSKEVVIVSAHYDHVGRQGGKIYNGADDNGSGTSGLLAVAGALEAYGPLKRSVLVIWVSGEEKGLWGSKAWSSDPTLPEGYRAAANLNMDMIGRNAPDELFFTPTREHKEYNVLTEVAMKLSPLEGFPKLDSADEYYHRSDQAEFAELGIPVAFVFAGVHEDYHQPSDTPDKIDYDKLSRVSRLIVRILDEIQDMPLER